MKYPFVLFILFFSFFSTLGQRLNTYTFVSSSIIGSSQTPFWMRANQWGAVPIKGQTISMFGGVQSDYHDKEKAIQIGYGLNTGAFLGLQNKLIIQEAYAKAKWKVFEAYVGRRKEIVGLVDSTLSSGSYIWSGNALPMPKIDISIPEYTSFKKNSFVSFKGNYAHGWFDTNRNDAKGLMLHQKSLYFKFGKPNYKFKLCTGFNHQVQWGGRVQYNDSLGRYSKGGKFGSSFRDYLYLVTGRSSVGDDTSNVSGSNELLNRVGNHLGSLDVAFEINLPQSKIYIYRQSIFEDGSLFYLNNITDGLSGISIKLNYKNSIFNIKKIVIENLNTLSQGGNFYDNPNVPNFRGQDNYFNNSQFIDGWSFKKTSIGSPYMLTREEYSILKNPFGNSTLFSNNKVQAFYFGINFEIFNEYNLNFKYSYSKNWGSFEFPPRNYLKQSSFSFRGFKYFGKVWNGTKINLEFASDFGDIFNGNSALKVGISKTWNSIPLSNFHPTHKH
jgi:hypothetical protein